MKARIASLILVAMAIVSFVLAMLAMFAGHTKGFMEDYAIVRLNTSMVGHNFVDELQKNNSDSSHHTGVRGWWDDIKNDTKSALADLVDHVADKLSQEIGLSEWYSLHVMNSCEGSFSPNTTAPSVSLNVTNCTSSSSKYKLNLTAMVDHQLTVGPVHLNLADIDWPSDIQDKLDILNHILLGLFLVYVLVAAFSGLAVVGGLLSFLKPGKRLFIANNFFMCGLGLLCSLIGSALVTATGTTAVKALNSVGKLVGISAQRGTKFITISWVTTAMLFLSSVLWLAQFFAAKKMRREVEMREKR